MLSKLGNLISKRKSNSNYSFKRWNVQSSRPSVDYEIVEITAKDKGRITDFLKRYYFPDEPFSKAFGGVVSDLEMDATIAQATNGLSQMAIEKKTNNLLGVSINAIYTKEESDSLDSYIKKLPKNDAYTHFFKLCKRLDEESKFWDKIGMNSCLRNAAICIDQNYRGMKIAYNLLESVKTVSNEQILRGESTQYASYQILLKQGWKNIYELNYQDYRDENNKVIINMQPPNTHLRLLIFDTGKNKI